MKRILLTLSILLTVAAGSFAQKAAKITFKENTYNFGDFSEDKGKVSCEFSFTNTSDTPLLITRAVASCGCTIPEYPKEPIAPGESGVIKVTYNAKGRPGAFHKNIYIYGNTEPEKTTLIIKGNVIPSKK